MKIAVLGYGKQGASAVEYWGKDPNNSITVCDESKNTQIPDKYDKKLGENYLNNLDAFDLIIRSPSIHPTQITRANTPKILEKVTTNTNEFFRVCPSKNIVGVTGTKGKGTTSTLVAKMLEASGKKVHLGGNIGTPPLEMLKDDIGTDDWIVLELANFQLIDIEYSPLIAICLMVVDEHLDWHKDSQEYKTAKQQLFKHQTDQNTAIYYEKNPTSKSIAQVGQAKKIPYFAQPGAIIENDDVVIEGQSICSTDEIKLLGKHNWQNVCAAVTAVWQVTQDVQAIRKVIQTFSGGSHRLELVGQKRDVKYYDDSFGTTPETSIVAIQSFTQPKVLILGGSDKGSDYAELADTVTTSSVKKVLLIGNMAEKIKSALDQSGFSNYIDGGDSMEQIVKNAQANASPGDVVLLSPACASFGMFKNYEDRGDQFKQAVSSLD